MLPKILFLEIFRPQKPPQKLFLEINGGDFTPVFHDFVGAHLVGFGVQKPPQGSIMVGPVGPVLLDQGIMDTLPARPSLGNILDEKFLEFLGDFFWGWK